MLNEVKHPSDYAGHHGFFADAQNDILPADF